MSPNHVSVAFHVVVDERKIGLVNRLTLERSEIPTIGDIIDLYSRDGWTVRNYEVVSRHIDYTKQPPAYNVIIAQLAEHGSDEDPDID